MKGSFVKRNILSKNRKKGIKPKRNSILKNRLKDKLVGIDREGKVTNFNFDFSFPSKSEVNENIEDTPEFITDLANRIYEERVANYFKSEDARFSIELILYKLHQEGFNIDLLPYCFDENGLYNLPIIRGDNISYKDWIKFNENSVRDFRRLAEFLNLKDTTKGFKTHLYLSAYLDDLEDIDDIELNLDVLLKLCNPDLSLWLFDAPPSIKEEFRTRTDNIIQDLDLLIILAGCIGYHTIDNPLNVSKDKWIEIRNMLLG